MNLKNKFILDACCGPRQMWYNKRHPNALYIDIRREEIGFSKWEKSIQVIPDIQADFRKLPNEIKSHKFKLIVMDIPHIKRFKQLGALTKKYGSLNPETWQSDIRSGIKEVWSVLDDYGVLLLKFCNTEIKFKSLVDCFPYPPLFFNTMPTKKSETRWFCFMKIPKANEGTTF